VLDAVAADPSTLAAAFGTLHRVSLLGGHAVPASPLAETFESIICRHAIRGEGSEVAWALWGALAWSVPLSKDAAALVSKMDDNIVALLALDADTSGLFPKGSVDRQLWTNTANQPDVLTSENWLLAYEANRQGWLNCPAVAADHAFSGMRAAGISFYDGSRNVPQFPNAARGLPGGAIPDHYA
jgi:hypothetical protein